MCSIQIKFNLLSCCSYFTLEYFAYVCDQTLKGFPFCVKFLGGVWLLMGMPMAMEMIMIPGGK